MLNKKALSALSVTADPNFKNVTLLLQGDGTNGAQNNTFIDSSTNNFTITRNGNTTQGSLGPFGNRWSNYFSSDTQYINLPASTNLNLNGDFTIEAWVYKSDTNGKAFLGSSYPTTNHQIQFDEGNVAGRTGIFNGSTWQRVTCSSSPNSQWFHLAYVRSGTTVTVYLNGVSQGTFTSSTNYLFTSGAIGALGGYNLGGWIGYISNFRIVKGTAVYTGNFTPSTTPLTAITNTQLLACQSNRFLDNSTNNFTLTPSSGVSVRPFSPFAPSAAYYTSVNGGSGYFDGSGDFLSVSSNAAFDIGSSSFTIEAWVYPTSFTNGYAIASRYDYVASIASGWALRVVNSTTVRFVRGNDIVLDSTTTIPLNAWTHIAVVRNGSTLTIYANGVQVGQATGIANFTDATTSLQIGRTNTITDDAVGYTSNLRVVKGTAVYTAGFTPPTAPLTAITNTSLLLNFTNGGIIDSAADNVLETVGNAQISTSVKKFGTGSLAFDGSGDTLTISASPDIEFGGGNFTFEFWFLSNVTSPSTGEFWLPSNNASGFRRLSIYLDASRLQVAWFGTILIQSSTLTWAANTWYHIAVVRNGNTWTAYRDGTSVGSTTNSNALDVASGYVIGGNNLNGYIDDLRITKGVARYTANFTPPAAPLPNQ